MTYPVATAADQFKLNFYNGIQALLAGDSTMNTVLVTYGAPGDFDPEDIVSFLGVESVQAEATISTNRSRNEDLTLEVAISVLRGGGPEMELVCAQRAYAILRAIEHWARQTDTTVGGSVLWCFLEGHRSSGYTDPSIIDQNRCIEIQATFKARARITGP